jgi:hypothetical protein
MSKEADATRPPAWCEKKRKKGDGKHQIFFPQAFAFLLMCYSSSLLLYCFTALLLLCYCVLTDVQLEPPPPPAHLLRLY